MITLIYIFAFANALAAIVGAQASYKSKDVYEKSFFGLVSVANAVASFVCFNAFQ
jgi:hypothetical protein